MNEDQQHKAHGKLPSPSQRVSPDREHHGAARLKQNRQELEQRKKKELQFRRELHHEQRRYSDGSEKLFQPLAQGRVGARWLGIMWLQRRRTTGLHWWFVTGFVHPEELSGSATPSATPFCGSRSAGRRDRLTALGLSMVPQGGVAP